MITLSANTAAFVYVIAVSAIESIGRDQIEAARVFGLTRWQVLRHIIALAGGRLLGRAAGGADGQPAAGDVADLGDRRHGPRQDRRQPQPADAEAVHRVDGRRHPLLPRRQAGRDDRRALRSAPAHAHRSSGASEHDRGDERQEGVRPGGRARRRQPHGPAGRGGLDPRLVGLGQVDADPLHQRAGEARRRPHHGRRLRRLGAQASSPRRASAPARCSSCSTSTRT